MARKWFKKAVKSGRTTNLDGWSKSMSASARRRRALRSRPSNWSRRQRYVSAGRALQALANVTQDSSTKRKADKDSDYFFRKAKKMPK